MGDNKRRIKKKKFKNKLHESATIEFLLHPCFKIRRKNIITKKIFHKISLKTPPRCCNNL